MAVDRKQRNSPRQNYLNLCIFSKLFAGFNSENRIGICLLQI
jgi:hypothetical protein